MPAKPENGGSYTIVAKAVTAGGTVFRYEVVAVDLQGVTNEITGEVGIDTMGTSTLTTEPIPVGEKEIAHTISISIRSQGDGSNLSGKRFVHLSFLNEAPEVEILSPVDGAEYELGEEITCECPAEDAEDGSLSGESVVWLQASRLSYQ